MARGDGELLSGLGNLIGAVTNTIERKNDQEFMLRREDTLTQLNNQREMLLTQFNALNNERMTVEQEKRQRMGQLASVGLNLNKDKLTDTGAVDTLAAITTGYLDDTVNSLAAATNETKEQLQYIMGAEADFFDGMKKFAISNKQWFEAMESDGALTTKEAKDLFKAQLDLEADDPANAYLFQGFYAAATDKEKYDMAMVNESNLETARLQQQQAQLEINSHGKRMEALDANIRQLNAAADASRAATYATMFDIKTKETAQAKQEMMSDFFSSLTTTSLLEIQAINDDPNIPINDRETMIENIITKAMPDFEPGIANVMRQQFVADVLSKYDLNEFINVMKSNPTAYSKVLEDMFVKVKGPGGVEQWTMRDDLGGHVMDLATAMYIYHTSGKKNLTFNQKDYESVYGAWANENYAGVEAQFRKQYKALALNPETGIKIFEEFGFAMHPDNQKTSVLKQAMDNMWGDVTGFYYNLQGPKQSLNKNNFNNTFSSYEVLRNMKGNAGKNWGASYILPTALITSGVMGDFDHDNIAGSMSLRRLDEVMGMGKNYDYFRRVTPEMMMERNATGESLLMDEAEKQAQRIGNKFTSFDRSEYTGIVTNFFQAQKGLNQSGYNWSPSIRTRNPVNNTIDMRAILGPNYIPAPRNF